MAGEAGRMYEDFATERAVLGDFVMNSLLVPIEVALGRENFSAMTKQLFWRLGWPLHVNSLVLAQVRMALEKVIIVAGFCRLLTDCLFYLECFPANVACQGGLASMDPNVLSQFVGGVELLVAIGALVGTAVKMPSPVVPQ